MSVNSYTYGTVKGVFRRVGWVVERQMFSANTQPTLLDVEGQLDDTASEIHARMAANGYPVSTKTSITTSAPRAINWLEALNEIGACAEILMTFPTAFDPESGINPAKHWVKRYQDQLNLIDSLFLSKLGLSRDEALSEGLYSGSYEDDDGNEKLPFFTRDQTDFPGSRSLTEAD